MRLSAAQRGCGLEIENGYINLRDMGKPKLLLRFYIMTHEDGIAGIGDDEEEEWVVDIESCWLR